MQIKVVEKIKASACMRFPITKLEGINSSFIAETMKFPIAEWEAINSSILVETIVCEMRALHRGDP